MDCCARIASTPETVRYNRMLTKHARGHRGPLVSRLKYVLFTAVACIMSNMVSPTPR